MKNKTKSFFKSKNLVIVAAVFLTGGFLLGRISKADRFFASASGTNNPAQQACGESEHADHGPEKSCSLENKPDQHGHQEHGSQDACGEEHTPQGSCADAQDSCGQESGSKDSSSQEHGHAGHGHGARSASLQELENISCEHDMVIVDCDHCRYEAGVLKVTQDVADPLLKTGLLKKIDRTKTINLTGQVKLDRTRTVEVVPTGGGRVEQVKKLLGEKVQKGDVLAVIHSDDLGQAKANFLEIQSTLQLAQTTYQREKELYEKKISSQAEYLSALNKLKAAEAAKAAVDKKLRLFGLDTKQIENINEEEKNGSFANLVLHAPQDGTIITQNLTVGQIVNTTESIYTIADLSNLWVWFDVYERDLAPLHEQMAKDKPLKATVEVKAFKTADFRGNVDFVGNIMDEHTRTVKMRIQVKNPENKLKPGMFADVRVAIPLEGQILAVPETAVMTDAGENFLFQHWKNDLWVRRDISIGTKYGNHVELISGVPQGTKIVTGGAFMLKSDILREKMGAGCAH